LHSQDLFVKTMGKALPALAAVAAALVICLDGPLRWLSNYDSWALDAARSHTHGQRYNDFPDLDIATSPEGDFLVVISPKPDKNLDDEWLAAWLRKETGWLKNTFVRHGAFAFRGFRIKDPLAFERVALAISQNLEEVYLGTSPRNIVNGTRFVHTASEFPPHRTIPAHLEMSFKDTPPRIQLFYGERADQPWGGESPLVDFAGVWGSLGHHLQGKLEKTKIEYHRRYNDCNAPSLLTRTVDFLMTKCWQDMFRTHNRSEVLTQCVEENFKCAWDAAGTLTIINTQPWMREHEITGKPIFFNHFNVLQPDSMIYGYQRTAVIWGAPHGWWPMLMSLFFAAKLALLRLFLSELELGHNVAFEGGSLLQVHELLSMKRAIWQNAVQVPWQAHDIVLVDNRRIGHGREMFAGQAQKRSVLAAWSDEYPQW
jgi:alpha-ketoglutarate-dependent taurine dioxygenase